MPSTHRKGQYTRRTQESRCDYLTQGRIYAKSKELDLRFGPEFGLILGQGVGQGDGQNLSLLGVAVDLVDIGVVDHGDLVFLILNRDTGSRIGSHLAQDGVVVSLTESRLRTGKRDSEVGVLVRSGHLERLKCGTGWSSALYMSLLEARNKDIASVDQGQAGEVGVSRGG